MKAMKRPRHPEESRYTGILGLDLRSLAAFRVAVSVFVIVDLVIRSFDLTAHYTDLGALPRAWAAHYYAASPIYSSWNPALLSVHFLFGSATGIAALFTIHALAAVSLLAGYRTRLSTIVVWFLVSSLQVRNPLVLSVGDDVLRLCLFFAIFLPLGARHSIDAAMSAPSNAGRREDLYVSPSTAIYYLQIISIYFFSALLKAGPEWRADGTALYFAFNIDQFALPLAKFLLGYSEFLRVLTFAAWWVELLGGFILLIPRPIAKLAGVMTLAGFQLGIGLTLALGHNPWINIIVLLPFVPGFVWNRRSAGRASALEIIYDGDCGVCRKTAAILVEFLRPDMKGDPRPAQGRDLVILRKRNSWIVRDSQSGDFFEFDAFVRLVASSPVFFIARVLRARPVHAAGTAAYRWIASRRGSLGRGLAFIRFQPGGLRTAKWREALAVGFFAAGLVYNLSWIAPMGPINSYVEPLTLVLRLEQYWGMFAPAPAREDGWYVFDGKLANGAAVEPFRNERRVSYEKPVSAAAFYPDERWRRYIMNIGTRDLKDFRGPLAGYVCWNWNRKNFGSDRLSRLSILFFRETTPAPGGKTEVQKLDLIDHGCAP